MKGCCSMFFKRLDDLLGRLLEIIITLCLASVVVITFLQVFFRYVLKYPLTWSQEALMISFVYSILFGAALAVKNDEHLKVDLFENIPVIVRKILNVFKYLLMLIIIILYLYYVNLLVVC